MNVVSAVKNLFGGSQHTGKVLEMADTAMKGVGTWIDEKKFTDEERSKANLMAATQYLDYVKSTMTENSVRGITRRWLAWAITAYVMFWASIAMVFAIAGKKETVTAMIDVTNAFQIGWAFAGVCALYFGVSFLRR